MGASRPCVAKHYLLTGKRLPMWASPFRTYVLFQRSLAFSVDILAHLTTFMPALRLLQVLSNRLRSCRGFFLSQL